MLPGLIPDGNDARLRSLQREARLKWMSAMIGTGESRTILRERSSSPSSPPRAWHGHAQTDRRIPRWRAAVDLTPRCSSPVEVVRLRQVIDWTTTGSRRRPIRTPP